MRFGTIIKKLRRERDLTQEELAETLSISPQAISRWETGVAMPDIALLPILCNYFNVSADLLLGIDRAKKKGKIKSIRENADKFSERGYFEKAREILEAGMREYPDSHAIMYDLMYLSFWQYQAKQEKTAYLDEAIRYGETILEKSTDDSFRNGAKQVLCYSYPGAGRKDEAVKLARSLPYIAISRETLLSAICAGDEGYRAKQQEAVTLMQFLSNRLGGMQEKLDSGVYAYTEEELAKLRDKRIALLHLFFEKGDFGFYHCHLSDAHTEQSKYYAKIGENEKAVSHLQLAAEHAVGFVNSRNDNIMTSLVFRGQNWGSWAVSSSDNAAAGLLKKLDDKVFDKIRESAEFAQIRANLSVYSGKWQVNNKDILT